MVNKNPEPPLRDPNSPFMLLYMLDLQNLKWEIKSHTENLPCQSSHKCYVLKCVSTCMSHLHLTMTTHSPAVDVILSGNATWQNGSWTSQCHQPTFTFHVAEICECEPETYLRLHYIWDLHKFHLHQAPIPSFLKLDFLFLWEQYELACCGPIFRIAAWEVTLEPSTIFCHKSI